jgi:glycosyltransferase involved in cell wall biosynthesis
VCVTGIGRYARTLAAVLKDGIEGHDAFVLGLDGLELATTSSVEEEFMLPALLEREEIDLYHSPLFRLPAVLPCRSVVTIHDAIPAMRPDLTNPEFAGLFAEEASESGRRADAVVCPSQHAKKDLNRALGIAAEKLHVVPETPDRVFRRSPEAGSRVRRRRGIEGDFFLVVGSLEERKNPGVVLDALARVAGAKAVFVGPAAGFDLGAEAARRGVRDRVLALGTVPDEELAGLYTESTALVFPSRHEGFGLPLVEAFACGTSVIASNATSLPEIAGDAATFFEPEDAGALSRALRDVLTSPELRATLVEKGTERLKIFTPGTVRQRLADLYTALELAVVSA